MSTPIEFSNLWDVIPEILEYANSSNLSNCRNVTPYWCDHSETLLRALWNKLGKEPPAGAVDILSNMHHIDRETSQENSTLIKFKKLAQIFKKWGSTLPAIPLPTTIHDFQSLQNKIYDDALIALWTRALRTALSNLPAAPPLPLANASANQIRAFLNDPNNSAILAQVTSIHLMGAGLKVVPPELDRLSGLQQLHLGNNQLTQVPDFAHLQNLTGLFLNNNQLSQVPDFAHLPNLTQLVLANNQLSQVPDFAHLQHLTMLSLSSNQLSQVPDFAHLQHLTWLSLNNNQLTQVPDFAHLQHLTRLSLNDNQLTQIPDFAHLQHLTQLPLNNNQLTQVPDFAHLQNLTGLFLNNNQLSQVPDFAHLQNLTQLYLHNNQLSQVPDFAHLQNLTGLFLNNNQLSQVPDFAHLQNLNRLFLSDNQLSQVPDFAHLPNLTMLSLNNNRLSQVSNFAHLPSLTGLFLDGNMLIVIPNVVLQRFPANIFFPLFDSQLTYKCHSSLALLCQTIMANKSSQEQINAFDALDQKDKNLIFEMVWEKAGKPMTGDSQWGEHHAFDDMSRFQIAVRNAIIAKLENSSNEKQNQVYGEIYHLADKPQTEDSQWGQRHAKENLPRLADALSRVN